VSKWTDNDGTVSLELTLAFDTPVTAEDLRELQPGDEDV
jgi:hypothetical protein